MDATERARLLDTLRKRRSRKKERALNEGKPEDFYITAEDFIDFYETSGGTVPQVKAATARRTSATRKKQAEPEPDEQEIPGGVLIGIGLAVIGCVIGIPYWIARNAS